MSRIRRTDAQDTLIRLDRTIGALLDTLDGRSEPTVCAPRTRAGHARDCAPILAFSTVIESL